MAKQLFSLCQTLFIHYLNDLSFLRFCEMYRNIFRWPEQDGLLILLCVQTCLRSPARLTLPIFQDVNKRGFYWMFNSPTVHAAGMKLQKSKHLSLHKKELTQQICPNNYLLATTPQPHFNTFFM